MLNLQSTPENVGRYGKDDDEVLQSAECLGFDSSSMFSGGTRRRHYNSIDKQAVAVLQGRCTQKACGDEENDEVHDRQESSGTDGKGNVREMKMCGDIEQSSIASRKEESGEVAELIRDLKLKTQNLRQAQDARESEVGRLTAELEIVKNKAAEELEALKNDLQAKTIELEEERKRASAGCQDLLEAEKKADVLSQQVKILEHQEQGMRSLRVLLRKQVGSLSSSKEARV